MQSKKEKASFLRQLHEQMIDRSEMKVSHNPKRKGAKRERYVIDFSTKAWIEKEKAVDLAALAGSTSAQYSMYWNMVVEFAEDHHFDYILTGKNNRKDEDFLLKYALYEFEVHGNSYDTAKGKLCAIRWCNMAMGYTDPLLDKPRLDRRLKGMMRLRGGRNPKKPVTVSMLRSLKEEMMKLAVQGDLDALAVYAGIITSYFFLLRISEYAAEDGRKASDSILRRCDVKFFRQGVEC